MTSTLLIGAILTFSPPAVPDSVVSAPPALSCTLHPRHGTSLLLGDVSEQTIALIGNGKCSSLPPGGLMLANSTDSARRGTVTLAGGENTWTITVADSILASTGPGDSVSGSWSIYINERAMAAGEKPVAQVMISPLSVAVATKTTTVYDGRPALTAAVAKSAKPLDVAYVPSTVVPAGGSVKFHNIANISMSPVGPVKEWVVSSTDATVVGANPFASVRTVAFTATEPSPLPLRVSLKATRPSGETFTVAARLADSSQYSSIPLNIADTAYLLCQTHVSQGRHDVIRANNLAAITNSAVTNDLCTLVISEDDIALAIAIQNNIPHTRYICKDNYRHAGGLQSNRAASSVVKVKRKSRSCHRCRALSKQKCEARKNRRDLRIEAEIEATVQGEERCKQINGVSGEDVTILLKDDRKTVEELKGIYGHQRVTFFVYTDKEKREESRRSFIFSSDLQRRREVALKFPGEPSPDKPVHVEVFVQPVSAADELPEDLSQLPERQFAATLRPKGPFGITHRRGSRGSRSVRIFVTVPVDFAVVRFPAAGLDIKSTRDSTLVQLAALTTGALLTFEPWDYTRGTNMYAVPMRFQTGLLMSNWYKGEFHPSSYLGYAITLPVFRGTSQLDTDLALGFGWEVDLRSGYDGFEQRSHFLVTLGMNILSLFGPKSAPRGK